MGISSELRDLLRPLSPPPARIYNLSGSGVALFLAMREGPCLMVERTEEEARRLRLDILFYRGLLPAGRPSPVFLPAADGPGEAGERAAAVHALFYGAKRPAVVLPEEALGQPLWRPEGLDRQLIRLEVRGEFEREALREALERLGYRAAPLVAEQGQYSMRGWLLDVFPSTSAEPFRVEFFGDEVESIRPFDIETQRSVSSAGSLTLMPAAEPEDGANLLSLMKGTDIFCAETVARIPEGATVLSPYAIKGEGVDAGLLPISGMGVLPEERKSLHDVASALKGLDPGVKALVVASSKGQAERLKDVLGEGGVVCPVLEAPGVRDYEGRAMIAVGDLSAGLFLPGLLVLTEKEIFGGRPAFRAMRKSRLSGLLRSMDDLRVGDYVVHEDHGIGIFAGLSHQWVEGYECDLMTVEYAGGDRLHLPLYSLDRIRKYQAGEGAAPKVDRLGTRGWERTRQRVRKRIRDMAEKLLKVHAEREVSKGFAFSPDTELHREFDSFFLYEETPDQLKAIEEIKRDMESPRPMDRLLCGDVGYGKTEVAMRAAFKAVYDSKQVAVLVPTTLLCEQHLRIFRKRFSAFPVNIDFLSRFKSAREGRKTLEDLARGRIDIIIATHALIKKDVAFRDLGLLIIDEEHRFGVRQKERLKELSSGVDVLAMSATPIPRTLQMSLSGIRSMSLIETPPEERLAVKTVVSTFDESLVREAITRERERGGQVFFVHNRIHDMERVHVRLMRVASGARVAVAHGRMPERQLERIMLSFLDMSTDVLLSTAIVGSGLDIPTANTIIIDRADRMGLADLYQLKGRVGRSNLRGFAYFLVPGGGALREEGRKRLQAIQELSYMGAGFRLAMRDLEIRGAGNLLGAQQSGYIHAVGFDMYVEMLERAVAELRGLEIREKVRTAVNIRLNAFIPEDYIEDMALRLSVYREIVSARDQADLDALAGEMRDRFGEPPAPFENLLRIMGLRLIAEDLMISGIRQTDGAVRFELSAAAPEAGLTAEAILGALAPEKRVRFFRNGFEVAIEGDPYRAVRGSLEALQGGAARAGGGG